MDYINQKTYSFDINKAKQIFNILLKDKQLKLTKGKRILAKEKIKDRKYCKYHNICGHTTNSYVPFKDMIEKVLKQGWLKFDKEKGMIINKDPFPISATFVEP